ncbi:TPA: CocE/NonD family hydrolase [Klebsiella oxytoca]
MPFDNLSDETIFDPLGQVVDRVGNWMSEGEALFLSPEKARAVFDVVEWTARLDWRSGKIG